LCGTAPVCACSTKTFFNTPPRWLFKRKASHYMLSSIRDCSLIVLYVSSQQANVD
jgi:hypothetical protein